MDEDSPRPDAPGHVGATSINRFQPAVNGVNLPIKILLIARNPVRASPSPFQRQVRVVTPIECHLSSL